jgi:hypothetical protein
VDVRPSRKPSRGTALRDNLAGLIEAVDAFVVQMANGDGADKSLLSKNPSHVTAPVKSPVTIPHGANLGTKQAGLVDSLMVRGWLLNDGACDWEDDHRASLVVFGSRWYSTG